jgi:Cysteine dioxygenase type I
MNGAYIHWFISISRLKLNAMEREHCTNFDATKDYTRNLVVTDNRYYTLLMLCWNPGRSSPVHNHPCDGCWMKVLKGRVQETLYVPMANGSLKPTMEQIHSGKSRMWFWKWTHWFNLLQSQRESSLLFKTLWDITKYLIRHLTRWQ